MILEKIKEHGGKIMFFAINILLIVVGVLLIKQKNTEKTEAATAEADEQRYKAAVDYALDAQQRIVVDQQAKVGSIANNSDTVEQQKTVPVTKTIPAVTKTVTTTQSSAKTTTKAS